MNSWALMVALIGEGQEILVVDDILVKSGFSLP
jgi:hypothetical protein